MVRRSPGGSTDPVPSVSVGSSRRIALSVSAAVVPLNARLPVSIS
jgi:hypothetical protein